MSSTKKKALIAILAMSSVLMTFMSVSPILAEIGKSFPDATTSQVQLVLTLPSLVALPIMLLAGRLTLNFSKKSLVVFGMCFMIVAGIIPQFLNKELWMLYIASAFAGFGMAYVNVLSSALISDHFKGVEKGKIMGFQSSALSLVGALMTTMSGSMADLFGWKYSYLVSLLTLPMLILVLALLPKDNVPEKTNGQQNVKLSGRVYYWGFLGLLTSIFINVFNTNIAMLIDESGLGGATISGTVTSVYMLIGIPAGLLLGWVVKKLKQNVVGIMCAIMAVGFFVIAFAQNLPLIYFGTFLFGIGFAIRSPAAITFMAYMVPSAASAIAIAILQACSQVGNFLSPLLVNWISEIAGGDTQTKFIISGIALIIIAAIYMFANPVKQHEIENN